MAIFVGIASYTRPQAFRLCLYSLIHALVVKGVITVIDVRDMREMSQYMKAISKTREYGLEVVVDLSNKRRGFINARNRVLDLAEQLLNDNDILVLYDDDYICPGVHAILPALIWFNDSNNVGLVGGRIVDLRRRSMDPDFYLNILPGLADGLSRSTGFIFLDTKHGPRYTQFTPPLRALRVKILKYGVRFNQKFKGTGYRSEDDFNLQVVELGYKIVFNPRFWALHLGLEYGGCRTENLLKRFYWKAHNHVYFVKKHRLGIIKLITGMLIIAMYSTIHGTLAMKSVFNGLRDGISQFYYV